MTSFTDNEREAQRSEPPFPSNDAVSFSDYLEIPESLDTSNEARSLVGLYDDILDLQEELYRDQDTSDLFDMEPEALDTWDLFNVLVNLSYHVIQFLLEIYINLIKIYILNIVHFFNIWHNQGVVVVMIVW